MGIIAVRFDMEIKYKKGTDNMVVDHLSRLEKTTEEKGGEIEKEFHDEQLFLLSIQTA